MTRLCIALALIPTGLLIACGGPPESRPAARSSDAASAAAPPLFLDATDATGLDFIHFNGMSGEFFFPEMTGG